MSMSNKGLIVRLLPRLIFRFVLDLKLGRLEGNPYFEVWDLLRVGFAKDNIKKYSMVTLVVFFFRIEICWGDFNV